MTHQRAMLPRVQPFHIGAQVWTLGQQPLLFSKVQRITHNDIGHAKAVLYQVVHLTQHPI